MHVFVLFITVSLKILSHPHLHKNGGLTTAGQSVSRGSFRVGGIADFAAGYRKLTGYEAGRKAGHDAGREEGYEAGHDADRTEED
jgi:hypothetical protein